MKTILSRYRILTALMVSVLMLTSGLIPAALAQSSTSGSIVGVVTDPSGAVVPGVTITVVDPSTKQARTTVSNDAGQYVLQNVSPGVYKLKAVKPGFATDEINALTVSVGNQTNASLKMAVGAESTTVDVVASNADVQTMNASTGQTVEPAMVDALPSIGREVASFATLQPGVSPTGQVAGTTQDQATFTLDGGQNSSDMDGTAAGYTTSYATSTTGGFGLAGGASVAQQGVMPMSQDTVEEFKVTTTGQTAEFNNSSGSNTQVVTKRGRDKVHGSAYEYYLDNNFNANSWQNNFPINCYGNTPTSSCPSPIPTSGLAGGTSYTPKPSYHFSRFGGSVGGPIAPYFWGGKTYLFVNYEGFRYPLAATYYRDVPSYEFLQQGQLTFAATSPTAIAALSGCTPGTNTVTCSSAQLTAADPRTQGFNPVLRNFYNTQLPVAPVGNSGSTGFTGTKYAGVFDSSCGTLAGPICDGKNIIAYKTNITTPQSSDAAVARLDHDFGAKYHLMASWRYYRLINLTSNQVDIGGGVGGDTVGTPKPLTPRPQQPSFYVVGLTTNISSSLTSDFHLSYLRNFWQWKGLGAPPQITGAAGVVEPLGESATQVLSPYNVNAQNIRTRIWDGQDLLLSENLTKLKGNHLIQFGGQYERNKDYHQRTDNGASINYTPTFQIGDANSGGGNIVYGAGLTSVGAGTAAYARQLDTYYGMVTASQVANTYTNANGVLTLNPPATAVAAHTLIPYYNAYVSDTWHVQPSLTLNLGVGWALDMPPTEDTGNQVMFTDATGNAIYLDQFLNQRKNAALTGAVYNPTIGFALLKNVGGGRKYPYDPFYSGFSPRLSLAWNPRFSSPGLNKIFGDGATVLRAGYGRIYGRLNGSPNVLNPLLSPGLLLGTQCKYNQGGGGGNAAGTNTCNQTNFTDSTVYRFGVDGLNPVTASATPPNILPQPYRPGIDGPGVSIASPIDPTMRPNQVDTFNVSIQRQINRKMLIEVGYIGRLITHEYIYENPNSIPYMLSQGGQSFASAYGAIEGALGCSVSNALCQASSASTPVPLQPFFETALAGTAFCTSGVNCTTRLVANQISNLKAQKVFSLWQALDNNSAGAGAVAPVGTKTGVPQFNFARSLEGTPTSNATYGGAGQIVTGLSDGTTNGYSNYHGGYVSFKTSGFHGLTAQENLTFSKALGLGAFNQYTSSISAEDSFNLRQQYGRQGFDQRWIFNTFLVYDTPWYKDQSGIVGRLAGGWTLAPVLTAGTGVPLQCTSNNGGQNFGGEDGGNFTDNENCIFTQKYTGGAHTHRGVVGSGGVGTAVHAGAASAAVNMFTDPNAIYQTVRPPILGLDTRDGGAGAISGLGYLNLDMSVKKRVVVYEKYTLEFSGVFFNVMNHLDFANPGLNLQSLTNWGVTKTQGNSPRQIQMGLRASF
jgi:hypothetical protein